MGSETDAKRAFRIFTHGLSDGIEVLTHGTSPLLADTDGDDDGHSDGDGDEVANGTDPLDPFDPPVDIPAMPAALLALLLGVGVNWSRSRLH
jgi:hypothetical protein